MNISSINQFIEDFCELHEISNYELFSNRRHRETVEKRMILAYFLRKGTQLSWSHIGKIMNRNHASMIHYVNKITDLIEGYPYMKEMFDKTNNLYAEYEFKLKEHNNIYQELLSENEKLRARIDRNEIMIKEIIDDKRKNYLLTT